MTLAEKVDFINNLAASHKAGMLDRVSRVPEDWDGVELRQWFADVAGGVVDSGRLIAGRKRRMDYNNAILTRCL